MKYLDYSRMDDFLRRYFNSPEEIAARMVGGDRKFDSGYSDIVRFFGDNAVDPGDVAIDYLPDQFEFGDQTIARFAHQMAEAFRKEGKLFEGPAAMKVAECNLKARPYRIAVQECSYEAQAGSCFALDYDHQLFEGMGGCLRNYYKREYPSSELKDNPLAICLGICGYLLIEESRLA